MKSIIKILNMESEKDVKLIQNAIANNSGIIASQVSLQKKEIVVIYDSIYLNEEKIIIFSDVIYDDIHMCDTDFCTVYE